MTLKNRRKRLQYLKEYRKRNRDRLLDYRRRTLSYCTALTGQDQGKCTAACELFVRADLSRRGFEVTVPVSPTAKHDLHVELPSVGWKGVQIKAGKLNRNTGHLRPAGSKQCQSPVLAIVHLPTNFISYRAGTEPLPEELT